MTELNSKQKHVYNVAQVIALSYYYTIATYVLYYEIVTMANYYHLYNYVTQFDKIHKIHTFIVAMVWLHCLFRE